MQNKDKGDGIEDSPLDMLIVILLEGASNELVTPSSNREYLLDVGLYFVNMLHLYLKLNLRM